MTQRVDMRRRAAGVARDGALRGALSLMFSAVAAGGLGLVFWSVAARTVTAADIGRAAAEISMITFLAGVGSLNLINVFGRFLPEAGHRTRRFITAGLLSAIVAGTLVGLIFLITPWAPDLVIGGTSGRVAFVVLVVINSIFMIQDGGLLGLGKPEWVPLENLVVALTRLALLPLLAGRADPSAALLIAWAVPMLIAVLVVNLIILRGLALLHADRECRLPARNELVRFIAIESVTTAISSSISALLPAIVTLRLGPEEGGYFYVPWVIATMIALLISSTLISLVREIVANPQRVVEATRRSLILVGGIVALASLVCVALPQLILLPLGPAYVENGVTLVRWIGLSLPATLVSLLYWSVCLRRRRAWPVFWLNAAISAGTLVGVLTLPATAQIGDVGRIHCVVQWVVALAVTVPLARAVSALRRKSRSR